MLLFLVLLCVSRMQTARTRQITLVGIAIGALCVYSHCAAFEFLIGAVLADEHLSLDASGRERIEDGNTERPKQKYHIVCRAMMMLLCVLVLAVAGYIISWPAELTPSYSWLQDHVPSSFEPTTSKGRGQSCCRQHRVGVWPCDAAETRARNTAGTVCGSDQLRLLHSTALSSYDLRAPHSGGGRNSGDRGMQRREDGVYGG